MAIGRISKRTVDALEFDPAGPAQQFLWDSTLAGFGVYVLATGKKVYVAQFRLNGRQQRIKIGPHGALTAEEGRAEAKRILGKVAHGADPAAERRELRAARTVSEVADQWLAEHIDIFKKPRTAAEYRRIVDLYIRPELGRMLLRDIRRADIAALRARMIETPIMANRTLATVSSMWSWAAKLEEVAAADNPAAGLERFRENAKERFLTTEELTRLGDVLRLGETEGIPFEVDETGPKAKHAPKAENRRVILDQFAVAAIRLLLLTGARLGEILSAKWDHVDFERGVIFLPDSKSGRKPLYLSAAAQEVLAGLPRIEGNPHIIAGAKASAPRSDLQRPWRAVRRAAGLEGLRLHDLRHSFASFGTGASLGLPIIGKLLGHTQAATTQRYAHVDVDPLHRAANTIGATIAAALEGKPGAEVKSLRRKRR
jgi:integrase